MSKLKVLNFRNFTFTAIPYRASTGPVQGQNRVFPVKVSTQGHTVQKLIVIQSCAKELERSLFQDSEETIHSAEENDTSYKRAGFFTEMK